MPGEGCGTGARVSSLVKRTLSTGTGELRQLTTIHKSASEGYNMKLERKHASI